MNDHKAFEKVLPSKLFEYASTGKPIWAGLKGYASDFMNENIDNCAIFSPFDIEEAELAFKKLKVVTSRHRFNKKFSSKEILDKMAKDIIRFAQKDEMKVLVTGGTFIEEHLKTLSASGRPIVAPIGLRIK